MFTLSTMKKIILLLNKIEKSEIRQSNISKVKIK